MTSKMITAAVAATLGLAASAAVYDVQFKLKTDVSGKLTTMTIKGVYDDATGKNAFWNAKGNVAIDGTYFGLTKETTVAKKYGQNAELIWGSTLDDPQNVIVAAAWGTTATGKSSSKSGQAAGTINGIPATGTWTAKTSTKTYDQLLKVAQTANKDTNLIGEVDAEKKDLAAAKTAAEEALAQAQTDAAAAKTQYESDIAQAKADSEKALADANEKAASDLAEAQAKAANDLAEAQAKAEADLAAVKAQAEKDIAQAKADGKAEAEAEAAVKIAEAQKKAEQDVADAKAKSDEDLAQAKADYEKALADAETKSEDEKKAALDEAEAKYKEATEKAAQEYADAKAKSDAEYAEATNKIATTSAELADLKQVIANLNDKSVAKMIQPYLQENRDFAVDTVEAASNRIAVVDKLFVGYTNTLNEAAVDATVAQAQTNAAEAVQAAVDAEKTVQYLIYTNMCMIAVRNETSSNKDDAAEDIKDSLYYKATQKFTALKNDAYAPEGSYPYAAAYPYYTADEGYYPNAGITDLLLGTVKSAATDKDPEVREGGLTNELVKARAWLVTRSENFEKEITTAIETITNETEGAILDDKTLACWTNQVVKTYEVLTNMQAKAEIVQTNYTAKAKDLATFTNDYPNTEFDTMVTFANATANVLSYEEWAVGNAGMSQKDWVDGYVVPAYEKELASLSDAEAKKDLDAANAYVAAAQKAYDDAKRKVEDLKKDLKTLQNGTDEVKAQREYFKDQIALIDAELANLNDEVKYWLNVKLSAVDFTEMEVALTNALEVYIAACQAAEDAAESQKKAEGVKENLAEAQKAALEALATKIAGDANALYKPADPEAEPAIAENTVAMEVDEIAAKVDEYETNDKQQKTASEKVIETIDALAAEAGLTLEKKEEAKPFET